jgi:hypothetical protein
MVICHTDDHPRVRAGISEIGVRVAFEADDGGYQIMQLHPGDTGGSFLEVDYQPGGEDPWGPWAPAGPDWQAGATVDVVDGIVGVTVSSVSAAATADRWSRILSVPAVGPSPEYTLSLDNADVRIVAGPVDSLVGVTLRSARPFDERVIAGVRFAP